MRTMVLAAFALLLAACGGGGGGNGAPPAAAFSFPPQPASAFPVIRLSGQSPLPVTCPDGGGGTAYVNAEVEPRVAVNPRDPEHLIAVWQQDRWSNGAARGAMAAVSFDGGESWQASTIPVFSRCAGGSGEFGDERASDPWVSIGADGTAYFMVLTLSGDIFLPESTGTMMVSRSLDGGRSWQTPEVLIRDSGAQFFNDKNAVTADPQREGRAYAVWDRLSSDGSGPSMLAMTTDAGASWDAPRVIYDPGVQRQTLSNQIVVLADGTLVNLLVELDNRPTNAALPALKVIRSTDQGQSWSAPIRIDDLLAVGTVDPDTGEPVRDAAFIPDIAAAADGSLVVVWQDARASGGRHDGILLSRSTNGGLSWSAARQVNALPEVPAFGATVQTMADGRIAVSYYDFRANTPASDTLPTLAHLAWSFDADVWQETELLGPFDLATAPNARGLFLGDYQGMVASGERLVPVMVQSYPDATSNRSDVFALQVAFTQEMAKRAYRTSPLAGPAMTSGFVQRVHAQAQRRREHPPLRR